MLEEKNEACTKVERDSSIRILFPLDYHLKEINRPGVAMHSFFIFLHTDIH